MYHKISVKKDSTTPTETFLNLFNISNSLVWSSNEFVLVISNWGWVGEIPFWEKNEEVGGTTSLSYRTIQSWSVKNEGVFPNEKPSFLSLGRCDGTCEPKPLHRRRWWSSDFVLRVLSGFTGQTLWPVVSGKGL